mmetsp:Transcript_102058/g.327519  ORF Transcript_102058/g.327519 Transcript_102058/m.327519 type:complete len:175 (+) Transcript_102058:213-737(+)
MMSLIVGYLFVSCACAPLLARLPAWSRNDRSAQEIAEVRANTMTSGVQTTMLMLVTWATALVHGVSATTPYAFMVAEPVVQEPWARLRQQWWKDVCRKEEMRSENLGRRRSRNGRSRSDDAMLKYIESCRSGGLPDGSMAKEKSIFEKCELRCARMLAMMKRTRRASRRPESSR